MFRHGCIVCGARLKWDATGLIPHVCRRRQRRRVEAARDERREVADLLLSLTGDDPGEEDWTWRGDRRRAEWDEMRAEWADFDAGKKF